MKCVIFIVILCANFNVNAQKISGVGPFEINKTSISIISTIEKQLHTVRRKFIAIGSPPIMINYVKENSVMSFLATTPKTKIFYVTNYQYNNVKYNHITMVFVNDTLIGLSLKDCNYFFREAFNVVNIENGIRQENYLKYNNYYKRYNTDSVLSYFKNLFTYKNENEITIGMIAPPYSGEPMFSLCDKNKEFIFEQIIKLGNKEYEIKYPPAKKTFKTQKLEY